MRTLIIFLFLSLVSCMGNGRGTHVPAGPIKVIIQPLGKVPQRMIDSVATAIAREHRATVHVAVARHLPSSAFTTIRTPRYRADTLIAWLRSVKPDSADMIIGLTTVDISITKYGSNGEVRSPASKYKDFGIFGLGYVGGPSCVVSTHRLGSPKRDLFYDRLKKIATHEIGHNRALPHCSDGACVMCDAAESIYTIDLASSSLCRACREAALRS